MSPSEKQLNIVGEETPQTGSLKEALGHERSWSLANSAISLIGLGEALLALVGFFYRNRKTVPRLYVKDFVLGMLALAIASIFFTITMAGSDFTARMVILDNTSASVIVLFLIQQAVLFCAKKPKAPEPEEGTADKHFRAKKRYDSER
jgi:LPXTG-motif cell wall-anchored protein